MGLRIGAGFRLSRHVYVGMTIPLGHHARRLARHTGHGDGSWLDALLGLFIMYVFIRVVWALAYPDAG
jgi:hypothetical protein